MIFLTQSLHEFPTYENSPPTDHVPFPWPQKGTQTKNPDEPCFFVHQMSGCPVCYCSTFKCVYTIFTFARYGNTLLIGGDHNVFIHQ